MLLVDAYFVIFSLANRALRADHASAHGGLSASLPCISFTVEHSVL